MTLSCRRSENPPVSCRHLPSSGPHRVSSLDGMRLVFHWPRQDTRYFGTHMRWALRSYLASAPVRDRRSATSSTLSFATEPFRPRLSCSRLVGGLEFARAFVPFICKLAVGHYALDAQPGEFVLVVRP